MPRSSESWDQLRNAFDPDEVLTGQRADAFYCEREYSPFANIRLDFRRGAGARRPPIGFFTGHRGSGKSSMLFRLLQHFKDDYFVVYFDIEHNLDSRAANQIDLLYVLGASIFQVADREGIHPESKNLEELVASLSTITHTTRKRRKDEAMNAVELTKGLLCFGAGMLGAGLGEKLAEALLKPFSITSGVSEETARSRQIEPKVQEVINNVNLIIADVEAKADRPVFVVVDGLDKLQRFEQADLIFLQSRALRGPVCRVIYTVPMLLFNHPSFGQAEEECKSYLLPNVKLYEKTSDDSRYESGYEVMREVVAKRLQSLQTREEDVFEEGVLDLVIQKSGGVLRWLILLVQNSMAAAEMAGTEKIGRASAHRAIDDRVAQLTGRLTAPAVEELRRVRKDKRPSGSKESGELLHGLFIVAYRNQSTWFDAHPLLWEHL